MHVTRHAAPEHDNAFERYIKSLDPSQLDMLKTSLRKSLSSPNMDEQLLKDASAISGMQTGLTITPYSLESPAYNLWPVVTLLRNRIPRRVVGGTGMHYKKLTAIDTAEDYGFVAENTDTTAGTVTGRAGFLKMSEVDGSATFKTLGLDNFLTVQQQFGGKSAIDGADFNSEELWTLALLQAVMMREEKAMLGANATALTAAAIGTPTKTGITQAATATGSLSASTNYYIKVSALTLKGYRQGAQGKNSGGTDSPGETDGTSEATIATAGSGSAGDTSLTIGWNAVKGAVAYNVFAGATTGASVKYNQTVTTNRAVVGANATATTAATPIKTSGAYLCNAADLSADTSGYDGLISLLENASGGYYKTLDGAALTGDSKAGCAEIEAAFAYFFTKLISPTTIYCSAAQRPQIDQIILGSAAPVMRINLNAGDKEIKGGISVGSVLNRYFNTDVELVTHPYLPAGTMLFTCDQLGTYYPTAKVPNPIEMLLGWDYMRFDFAQNSLRKESGVYVNGCPVVRVPFSVGAIHCIA